jgi:PAS domain S-box-containing protein
MTLPADQSPFTRWSDSEAQAQIHFQSRLLEAIGQAVVATDAAGAITYWNPAAERIFGWSESEVLGRPVQEVVVPEGDGPVAAEIMGQLGRGEQWSGEFHVRHRDGTVFPLLVTDAPVFDDSGTLVGIIGVSTDLRDANREALQRSEERLRGVVDASPLALVELNADAEVSFWNTAAEALYGWSPGEVEGRRPLFSRPEEQGDFDGHVRLVMAGEHLHNLALVRQRKDGTLVNVSVSMAPLRDGSGQVVGVTSAALDVTRQFALEAALREAQKLDGIGRVAGNIAHDFNNLLTVILGHAEQMLQDLSADDPTARRVQVVHRAARRAADLTDQLLAFSRHAVTTGEPTDLNEVLLTMQALLDQLVGDHIELRMDLCDGSTIVAPDWSQIQGMVSNLVLNARDAMPDGGVLGIATELVPAVVGPDLVRLHVSDTGSGIDESIRALIFEPFFSTKTDMKGTGLGLSTVFGVVTQHGGEVDLSSRLGAGSVFSVSLPRWVPTNGRASDRSDEKRSGYPPG